MARVGDQRGAEALISTTPLDCYTCVSVRGQIASNKRDWVGASAWFANAVRQAPSLPFAYVAWARMLADKGELGAALDKLTIAHEKAPRYADAIEVWAEILARRGDLRGAAAKLGMRQPALPDGAVSNCSGAKPSNGLANDRTRTSTLLQRAPWI